jgi:hypothetical protein
MRKHPVSIALSKRTLACVDQEARAQKRSRSDWLELHLEEFFKHKGKNEEIAIKFG